MTKFVVSIRDFEYSSFINVPPQKIHPTVSRSKWNIMT